MSGHTSGRTAVSGCWIGSPRSRTGSPGSLGVIGEPSHGMNGGFRTLMLSRSSTTARSRGDRGAVARVAMLVPLLALLGRGGVWNSVFGDKHPILPDEPADRLYNQGVFLMNEKHDYKESAKKFEEVDRQH